jgi:antitoxin component of RelBE/YafQ-DinJ toxin-antitoxin module
MPKERKSSSSSNERTLKTRLDALIRLVLETMYANRALNFDQAKAANVLKSVGLTPTEIAHVMGKKTAQDVSSYLYGKKRLKTRRKKKR